MKATRKQASCVEQKPPTIPSVPVYQFSTIQIFTENNVQDLGEGQELHSNHGHFPND